MPDDLDMLDYVKGIHLRIIDTCIVDGKIPDPASQKDAANMLSRTLKDAASIEIAKKRLVSDEKAFDERKAVLSFMAEMGRQKLNPHITEPVDTPSYERLPVLVPDAVFADGELKQGADNNTFNDFMDQQGMDQEGNPMAD